MRSRTVTARLARARRRRRLVAANLVLAAGIAAVALWSTWLAGERSGANDAGRTASETTAPSGIVSTDGGASSGTAEDGGAAEPLPSPGEAPSAAPSGGDVVPAPGEDEPTEETVSFAFVGDVLLGEYVGTLLKRHGFDYPYEHVRETLQQADFAVANLETAVTSISGEKPGLKTYEFRSDPEAMPAFREAGFDLVSLANNHTLDFGPEGLRDTMRHLDANEIAHVGAGESAAEAFAPVYLEKNGLRIAVLGFSRVIPDGSWKAGKQSLGLADAYDYRLPVGEIEAAKAEADLVVVLVHWGEERSQEPDPLKQVDLGRRFVDAGADLVIGSHPHVLQGIERYKDRWIAYSLGNFIFTKSREPLTYDSGILEAACTKSGDCELRLTPYAVDTPQPTPMNPERAAAVLKRVSDLSVGATIDADGRVVPTP